MKNSLPQALVDAVLSLMAFLELSEDDVVDPDSTVAAMESVCADLQELTQEQQEALLQRASELAEQSSDPRLTDFLRRFGEGCGLLDETP